MTTLRPPKPPMGRYSCPACGPLTSGKPHKSFICRILNKNKIVGADDELIFDEIKWNWVEKIDSNLIIGDELPEGYTELTTIDGRSIIVQTHIPLSENQKCLFINPDPDVANLFINLEYDHNDIKERIYKQLDTMENSQILDILRDANKNLTYLIENDDILTDEMIQIELNTVRENIKKLTV